MSVDRSQVDLGELLAAQFMLEPALFDASRLDAVLS